MKTQVEPYTQTLEISELADFREYDRWFQDQAREAARLGGRLLRVKVDDDIRPGYRVFTVEGEVPKGEV